MGNDRTNNVKATKMNATANVVARPSWNDSSAAGPRLIPMPTVAAMATRQPPWARARRAAASAECCRSRRCTHHRDSPAAPLRSRHPRPTADDTAGHRAACQGMGLNRQSIVKGGAGLYALTPPVGTVAPAGHLWTPHRRNSASGAGARPPLAGYSPQRGGAETVRLPQVIADC